jgi:hypothetical protein
MLADTDVPATTAAGMSSCVRASSRGGGLPGSFDRLA